MHHQLHVHIYAPYTHSCTPGTDVHHMASPITGIYLCTIYTYMHHQTYMRVDAPYTHTCTTQHTCAPHASLNSHVHHQTPPKIKIYLDWPSLCTLWQTRSKWEICVESAAFLLLLRCFSWKVYEKHMKSAHFSQKVPHFTKSAQKTQCFSQKVPIFMKRHRFSKRPLAKEL